MAKTDTQVVKDVLDRMGDDDNASKAREVTRVLGKRIRQRARNRTGAAENAARTVNAAASSVRGRRSRGASEPRYRPVRIQGEPLSSTILRDRGSC
jgi:hypothetical protein